MYAIEAAVTFSLMTAGNEHMTIVVSVIVGVARR
jgi:hypothetical protein